MSIACLAWVEDAPEITQNQNALLERNSSYHGGMERRKRAGQEPRAATTARRASVLAAALDCFGRLGIDATTIQDIQQAANCSVGSLYHHFGSKEGIAEELFIDGIRRFNDGMVRKLRRCGGAEASVKAVVAYTCDWTTRNRALASYLHSRDIDFSAAARARLKEIYRQYLAEIFALFAPFVASGEMRVLPAETYVPLISGPIQEYVRRWLSGHYARAPGAVKDLFADAAWNAVQGTGRASAAPDGSNR
jgi:AcrR family transcriptional regulator